MQLPHHMTLVLERGLRPKSSKQAPVVQDAVGQLPVDPAVQNDVAPAVGGQLASMVVLTEDEQCRYERFQKIDPP